MAITAREQKALDVNELARIRADRRKELDIEQLQAQCFILDKQVLDQKQAAAISGMLDYERELAEERRVLEEGI